MPSYYKPLQPGCIRLLEFLDDSGLNLTIGEQHLDIPPPYYALSYAWREGEEGNDAARQHEIAINNEATRVQRNLYDALTHIGSIVRENNHRIWVDFVCINQDDIFERAQQVQLMKKIYEQANRTCGWLGLPYDDQKTKLAVALMKSFFEFTESFGPEETSDEAHAWLSRRPGFPGEEHGGTWAAWEGMSQLFGRTYWQRTWIYQEATVKSVTFVCGKHFFHIAWLQATLICARLYRDLPGFPESFKFIDYDSPVTRMLDVRDRRVAFRKHRRIEDASLTTLINELRRTSCTDARDKVFATLPHAVDVTTEQLRVDYRKDLLEVYSPRLCLYFTTI